MNIKIFFKTIYEKVVSFFMLNEHGRFSAIDGLRAWAILSVFNVHLNPMLVGENYQNSIASKIINTIFLGHLGVDLFFVISGFLIYRSLTFKETTLIRFGEKRLKRLLPVHLVVLLSMMTVNSLESNILNIFFVNYFFSSIPIINFVTWSLSYEILFYLIAGLWLINYHKYKSKNLLIFFISLIGLEIFYLITPKSFYDGSDWLRLPDVRFIGLFVGAAFAMFYESPFFTNAQKYLPALSLFAILACIVNWSPILHEFWAIKLGLSTIYSNIYYGMYSILFGILCLSMCTTRYRNPLQWFFKIRVLRCLGIISYSLYLSHAIFGIPIAFRFIEKHNNIQNYPSAYLISLAISIVIACFLFNFLEKPYFISKKHKTN